MADTTTAPARTARRHRRTYLVDRAFQLKYTLLLMGVGLVVALVFGFWIYQAHRQSIALLVADPLLVPEIQRVDRQLLVMFVGIAVLMSVALGLIGVLVTHRVSGPVFVMGYYMSVLAEGRYPRMRTLRKSDELRNLFEVFLRAVAKLKERESRHAAMLEDVVAQLRAARVLGAEPVLELLEAAALERRIALTVDDPDLTPQFVRAPPETGSADGS